MNLGFELNKFLHVTRVFVCAMDWDGILCDVNGYGIVMLFGKILFLAFGFLVPACSVGFGLVMFSGLFLFLQLSVSVKNEIKKVLFFCVI